MSKISLLEKATFELVNIASDATLLYGAYSLSQGNKNGLFYACVGICGEILSLSHAVGRKYTLSDMVGYSKWKYSLPKKILKKIKNRNQ